MELRINSQPALIGLNIQKPAVKLDIRPPQTDLTASIDQVEIEATDPRVRIDLIQCHQDAGYYKPVAMMNKLSQQCLSEGLQGIAGIASKGDSLANISSGITVVSIITSQDRAENQQDFNVTAVPKHAPGIEASVIPLNLDIQDGKYNLDFKPGDVLNQTNWSKVKMYLLQKPSVQVQWTGSHLDAIA